MKKSILIIGIFFIFFASCNKENSTSTTSTKSVSILDYFPLKQGNYWVYKQSICDSSGNTISSNWKNDSMVVKNDTVINNLTYHTIVEYNFYVNSHPTYYYYRDSANCIVNNLGEIVLSFDTGIYYKKIYSPDTALFINYSYINQLTSVIVPLGTYNCVDFRGEFFRKMDNYNVSYFTHKYCSKNIGIVKKINLFSSNLNQVHLDLIMYYVQ